MQTNISNIDQSPSVCQSATRFANNKSCCKTYLTIVGCFAPIGTAVAGPQAVRWRQSSALTPTGSALWAPISCCQLGVARGPFVAPRRSVFCFFFLHFGVSLGSRGRLVSSIVSQLLLFCYIFFMAKKNLGKQQIDIMTKERSNSDEFVVDSRNEEQKRAEKRSFTWLISK